MASHGTMLRLARQRRLIPQKEAAPLIGTTASDLSRIENGLKLPSEEILQRASAAFRVPRSFFDIQDQVYGAPVSVHPMWRKKADVSAGELDAVVAELNIRVMHMRRLLDAADIRPSRTLPSLDLEEFENVEKIAGLLRAHWQLPAGPIPNLTHLVEEAGIVVVHSSLGGSSISGVTFRVPGVPPLIVLNAEQPADRMRFTLAHELGHIVMHRFPSADMEKEANEFASYFLAPSRDIRPYFQGGRVDLPRLAALKPEWRMSMAGLLFVADRLGLITQNQKVYLWKQFSIHKYRLREPPELDFDRERPEMISDLLRAHVDQLGYSAAELASLMSMEHDEFAAFYDFALPKASRGATLRIIK